MSSKNYLSNKRDGTMRMSKNDLLKCLAQNIACKSELNTCFEHQREIYL